MEFFVLRMRIVVYIISLFLFFVSCTEVMDDFEVGSAEAKIVVEGTLSENHAQVILSKTTAYLNPTNIPYLSGAQVTISYGDTIVSLHEDSVGFYSIQQHFEAMQMYELAVLVDDKLITAKSYMPPCVKWDSVVVRLSEYNEFLKTDTLGRLYEIQGYITDPQGTANYYRTERFKNDTIVGTDVTDDGYFNGQSIPLITSMGLFKDTDKVKIYLKNIDKQAYEFYQTLAMSNSSSGMFSAPDNPKSNLQGDALGRFYAYSIDSLNITFEE